MSNINMINMLQFYNIKKKEEQDDDKIKSMSYFDNFKIDANSNFDFGNIYFVVREKQYEGSNDSYMYYEIYDINNLSNPIAKTNENFEIEILDEDINKELLKHNIDLTKDKKMIREMVRENENGDLIPTCAVMDKFDKDKNKDKSSLKQIKRIKEETVYNDKKEQLDNSLELTENEIKEKSKQEGKQIIDMYRIEDPMFYQLVPDATISTYFVNYDDGSIGIVNSHGEDISSMDDYGVRNGSLSLHKMERSEIQTDSKDAVSMDMAIYIEGSSQTHGIVFPVVNKQGIYQMEMKDIYDKDQHSMPLSMQGSGNYKDNRQFLGLDEKIVDILKENGVDKPKEKVIEELSRYFYDKGDSSPDEISVIKEYKRLNINEQEVDMEIEERKLRETKK